jgi:hypothetical protein
MTTITVEVVHCRIDIKSTFDTFTANLKSNLSKFSFTH